MAIDKNYSKWNCRRNNCTADIADGSVDLVKLSATGTKNNTTFLRGDNTFSALSNYSCRIR